MDRKSKFQLQSEDELEDKDKWLCDQPENQQIHQFKVVLRNLPHMQKHKWPNRSFSNKCVQSLSNLECIIEDSDQESNVNTNEENNNENVDFVNTNDQQINLNETDQFNKPIQLSKSKVLAKEFNNEFNSFSSTNLLNSTNQNFSFPNTLNSITKQSNLNTKNTKLNYKQVNSEDNLSKDNFFFGPANQDYESLKLRSIATRNQKISIRQNLCDYLTIFLIISAFLSILVSVVLLFLIALDTNQMQTTFTIILIILCILTFLLVLFASFTANFVWFYNSSSNSIDWMLHYGRKNRDSQSSNYYFGRSLNRKKEENNNETESNLIEKI